MAQRTERSVLNHLIEVCRDGERGFRVAADEAADPALRTLFLDMAGQRERFAAELLPHAQRLGGPDAHEGSAAASLHRRWIHLKAALTHHDEHAILAEAERGDRVTLHAYRDAVEDMLPPVSRDLIERQYEEVQKAQERFKTLDRARTSGL